MAYSIDYINLICTDLGGTGGHAYEIDGMNEICTLIGATAGHSYNIDALNAICTALGYTAGHEYNIDALNAIYVGGAYVYEDDAWEAIQVGSKLSYLNQLKNLFGSSIISLWPFNDSTGATATDVVNLKNGVYTGVTLYQAGFNLQNKSVLIESAGNINIYNAGLDSSGIKSEGSFMIYFKTDETFWTNSETNYLFTLYTTTGDYIYIRKTSAANSTLSFLIKGGTTTKSYTHIMPPTSGWNNIFITWSVSNLRFRIYLNSKKIAEVTGIETITGNFSNTNSVIGAFSQTSQFPFKGNLSCAMLLNKEATESEIFTAMWKTANVIFEGDSRMASYNIPTYALDQINNKLYVRTNVAVSGSKVSDLVTRAADVDALIKPATKNILVVFVGVNNHADTAEAIYNAIKSYCMARKAAGHKILLCKEIDAQGVVKANWHDTGKWTYLNALIDNDHSFVDDVIDLAFDVRLQNAADTNYFNADQVHPIDAGARVIAALNAAKIDANS